jgi:hypothetical protein
MDDTSTKSRVIISGGFLKKATLAGELKRPLPLSIEARMPELDTIDLAKLEQRAEEQRRDVESMRLKAVKAAFGDAAGGAQKA